MDKTVILHKRILKNWEFSVERMGLDLRIMCWVDDQFYYFYKKIIKRIEQKLTKHEATFDKFWSMYPKKVWKKAAETKFMLLKEDVFDNLFTWLKQYLKQWDNRIKTNNKEFIPAPAAWLHQERWTDEIDIWQEAKSSINRDKAKAIALAKDKKEALEKLESDQIKKKIQDKILELEQNDPGRLKRMKDSVEKDIKEKTPNTAWKFYINLVNIWLKKLINDTYFNNT